jgi:hypothetical protein
MLKFATTDSGEPPPQDGMNKASANGTISRIEMKDFFMSLPLEEMVG